MTLEILETLNCKVEPAELELPHGRRVLGDYAKR